MRTSIFNYALLVWIVAAVPAAAQQKSDLAQRSNNAVNERAVASGPAMTTAGQSAAAEKLPANASDRSLPDASGDKPKTTPEPLRIAPVGQRDPFRPLTLNSRPAVKRRENLSPLERYELGQLKLVGIIWSGKEPVAIVEDAAGLGYLVKVGTPIGVADGSVKTIKQNEITVEESFVDLYGARKRREVIMKVSPESAE